MRRTLLVVSGGTAWVLTSFVTWTAHGNGSTLNGVTLARWLNSGPSRPTWGPIAARAMFALSIAGCLVIATSALRSRAVLIARSTAGGAVVLAFMTLSATSLFPLSRWGAAAWTACLGGLVLAASPLSFRFPWRRSV